MRLLTPLLRAAAAGLCGGGLAWATLEVVEALAVGHLAPVAPNVLLAYLFFGALVGATYAGLRGAARPPMRRIAAASLATLYAPLLYDRVALATAARGSGAAAAAVAGLAAIGAYAVWVAVLQRLTRSHLPPLGGALAAASLAVILVLDRNLFTAAFAPATLVTELGVALGAVAVALLSRVPGRVARPAVVAVGIALATAALAQGLAVSRRPPGTRSSGPGTTPDLVLIVVDTMRADVFEAVLRETAEGRAFRAALRGGTWFTRAFAVSPWTLPSMGSILTGLYPTEHGLERDPTVPADQGGHVLAGSVRTLAEALRARGYWTEAINTNHNLHRGTGIFRGFDRSVTLQGDAWKIPLFRILRATAIVEDEPAYRDAAAVRRRLGARLRAVPGGALFVWLQLMDTHAPLQAHAALTPDPAAATLPRLDRSCRNATRYALREVTAIIDALAASGRWSNTLFVLTSDHGEMLPSDGHPTQVHKADGRPKTYGHGHALYDTLLRVPLVIRSPGGRLDDRETPVFMNQVDLHVTLRALLGIEALASQTDAVNLAAWVGDQPAGELPAPRTATIAGSMLYGPDQRALRTEGWKLIEYPAGQHGSELYDLVADPRERRNLAGEDPARLAAAQAALDARWSTLVRREAPQTRRVDAATRDRLRALGYDQ